MFRLVLTSVSSVACQVTIWGVLFFGIFFQPAPLQAEGSVRRSPTDALCLEISSMDARHIYLKLYNIQASKKMQPSPSEDVCVFKQALSRLGLVDMRMRMDAALTEDDFLQISNIFSKNIQTEKDIYEKALSDTIFLLYAKLKRDSLKNKTISSAGRKNPLLEKIEKTNNKLLLAIKSAERREKLRNINSKRSLPKKRPIDLVKHGFKKNINQGVISEKTTRYNRHAYLMREQRCLKPRFSKDADVRRNAKFIEANGLCYKSLSIKDRFLTWHLTIVEKPGFVKAYPKWAVPHDNEDSAFATALTMVAAFGGRLVAIEASERRYWRGQDPNRSFALKKRCRGMRHLSPKYTKTMISLLKGGRAYLALHSNANGYFANGGQGQISVHASSGSMKGFPALHATGRMKDEDNMVIISGIDSFRSNAPKRYINILNRMGMNVVYEHVTSSRNDCSLSNYLVLNHITKVGSYFNIEVQHCDYYTQLKIATKLLMFLGYERKFKVKGFVNSCKIITK